MPVRNEFAERIERFDIVAARYADDQEMREKVVAFVERQGDELVSFEVRGKRREGDFDHTSRHFIKAVVKKRK